MLPYEIEEEINKILGYRTYRSFLDDFDHHFGKTEPEEKIHRLAQLVFKNYFDLMVEEYLSSYSGVQLEIMTNALRDTLTGYIGLIRLGSYVKTNPALFWLWEKNAEEIIQLFKADIENIYFPQLLAYFDESLHQSHPEEAKKQLESLARITKQGYLSLLIKTFLSRYEGVVLDVFTGAVREVLINFSGLIRLGEYGKKDAKLKNILQNYSLYGIIDVFKDDVLTIYWPQKEK